MAKEISKIEEITKKLEDVNNLIKPYQLAYVSPVNDCVSLKKNAHYMEKDMLDKLTSNISEDGFLSQLPFGVKQEDGKFLIISGNHRLKASIKAKLEYILILYVENISKDKQIAYQLSHNALVGKDDINILREIYQEIESLEGKQFAGLNGLELIDIDKIKTTQINDVNIDLTEIKFLFIESRVHEINKVIEVLEKCKLDENSKIVYGDFNEFIKVLTGVKAQFGIKSNTVAFGKMIDICEEYILDHKEEMQFTE